MINYEQEVKKVYPDAKLRWWPRSETYTIEHNGLTIYGSQHIYSDYSWKSAYEKLNQPKHMTPLQKSIAEIEAMIEINKKQIEDVGENKPELLKLYSIQYGLQYGLQYAKYILTDNLKYEREEIENAYNAGSKNIKDVKDVGKLFSLFDAEDQYVSASDYYTKTYEHERKD